MMRINILTRLSIALSCLMAVMVVSAAPESRISLQLDSAHLLMGKATALHLNVVGPRDDNAQIIVPQDSFNAKVEVLRLLKADTIDHGNGRWEINQDILIQSFDSGDYRLKPVYYISGGDTIASNHLALRVLPVMADSLTLNDFEGVSDIDRKWADYLPDFIVDYWWAILILILLAAGLYFGYNWYDNRSKPQVAKKKEPELSPYDQAITNLAALRTRNLCEQGQEKEYYSELTDILRVYLMRRFDINALEMTSSQIRSALRSNPDTRLPQKYMDQVMEIADFVKFAKVRPLPVDNVRTMDNAVKFVEETKPVPPAAAPVAPEETKQ